MNTTVIAIIVILALVVIGAALMMSRRKQGERLKQQFGAEYDHQVEEAGGSRAKAESRFWRARNASSRSTSTRFRPNGAAPSPRTGSRCRRASSTILSGSIALADALVAEVMKARGYPVDDFEQRAADISVEHPQVVQNYRAAHEIALRQERGQADTEDLRSALLGYRSLFEELLHADQPELAH